MTGVMAVLQGHCQDLFTLDLSALEGFFSSLLPTREYEVVFTGLRF